MAPLLLLYLTNGKSTGLNAMVRGSFCSCRAYGCHMLAVDLSSSRVIKPALELPEVDALVWVWKRPVVKKKKACSNNVGDFLWYIGFYGVAPRYPQIQGFIEQSFWQRFCYGAVECSSIILCFQLVTTSSAVACWVWRDMLVPGKILQVLVVNKL